MSPLGTNYAEQAEVHMPTIYDLYREDFENIGIEAVKYDKTDSIKELLKNKIKVPSPLFSLLFDYNDENFEWYKPIKIVNRLGRLAMNKDETALNKKYGVVDTQYFRVGKAATRAQLTLDDVMFDKVPLKENDELLKDIAFMPLSTMNRLPTKATRTQLLDLLQLRVDLTTWLHIKKRRLFSHESQPGIQNHISQNFIPNRLPQH
jgi:hypothetical protein